MYPPLQRELAWRHPARARHPQYYPTGAGLDDARLVSLLGRRTGVVKIVVEENAWPLPGLMQALAGGSNPALRELTIRKFVPRQGVRVDVLLELGQALARRVDHGGCSALTALDLGMEGGGGMGVAQLRAILRPSTCHALQSLRIEGVITRSHLIGVPEESTMSAVADLLATTGLPDLLVLDLFPNCGFSGNLRPGKALLPLFTPGVAPKLRTLRLRGMRLYKESWEGLLRMIERRAWPELTDLTLQGGSVHDGQVEALVRAMLDAGGYPGLRSLDLGQNGLGDEGLPSLERGLTQGVCPSLECLRVGGSRIMRPEGLRPLAEALLSCPALTTLDVSAAYLGDDGVRTLIEAIEGGVGSRLTEVDLSHTGLSGRGLQALSESLEEGAWPRLRVLGVSEQNLSDYAYSNLFEAVPRLIPLHPHQRQKKS